MDKKLRRHLILELKNAMGEHKDEFIFENKFLNQYSDEVEIDFKLKEKVIGTLKYLPNQHNEKRKDIHRFKDYWQVDVDPKRWRIFYEKENKKFKVLQLLPHGKTDKI